MRSIQTQSSPRWVGACAEVVTASRGRPIRLKRVFERSSVPMIMVDHDRRCVHANVPARLAMRHTLAEIRRLRLDDLTASHLRPVVDQWWARLTTTGCIAGRYVLATASCVNMEVTYYALADAAPGLNLIAFAPAGWPDDELLGDASELPSSAMASALTERELEVLELAADGHSAPMIASELVLSPATVRTHFANIYDKLEVRDRAAAVAKAMRTGLIS